MQQKLKYKIINYFGDYGTANFWSNISFDDITRDLKFISEQGFNTILIVLPYADFKPNLENFDTRNKETLEFILSQAKQNNLEVIFRIGYLWESNFHQNRTLERYIDMYSCFKNKKKSVFEDDFISYINHYYDNYKFLHMMLSWEDLFWPIHFYNLDKRDEDQYNERETVKFTEHLLNRIGYKEKLHIEQRTNGDFDKIRYNGAVSYAYYNTLNVQSWDDDFIGHNFGRGIIIDENMLVEKQFVEWYSRMQKELELDDNHNLIIDQFNIIDNTFDDDTHHNEFLKTKQKLICTEEKLDSILRFIGPIIKNNILGIGFWSLWTTYAGHVYNGTFKYESEGWETDGYVHDNQADLKIGQSISTNLGYIRLDDNKTWNILIKYSANTDSKILVKFNNTNEVVSLTKGNNVIRTFTFNYISDKGLSLTCIEGSVSIERIDCYNIRHKSFLFDENRNPICKIPSLDMLLS